MEMDISSAVAGLVVVVLITLAECRRGVARRRGVLMVYASPVAILSGGFAFGAPAAMLVAATLSPQNRSWDALSKVAAILAAVSIPSLWIFCTARRTKVLLTGSGILGRATKGGWRRIRWKDVSSVTYSALLGGYAVHGTGAPPVQVSQLLVGQKQFAEAVLRHVSAPAIECAPLLRRMLAR